MRSILFLFSCLWVISSVAQDPVDFFQSEKTIPFQKVYLHTDREFYFIGDTLWFAAYVLDAKTHRAIPADCNLYIDLINAEGEVVCNNLFEVFRGHSAGSLGLADDQIDEGNYLLRAYTDYLKPFGDEMFFTKMIHVLQVKNSYGLKEAENETTAKSITVNLFPEGGFLIENRINQLAYKVTDQDGMAVNAKGSLIDGSGNIVLHFETMYSGMGKFLFVPRPGEKYSIKLEGFEASFELPEPRNTGTKLMLARQTGEFINFNILAHRNEVNQIYSIAVLHRGEGIALVRVNSNDLEKMIQIDTKYLLPGINRFVLLNEAMEPLSERLVFKDSNDLQKVDIKLDAQNYATRAKVELALQVPELKLNEFTRLSLAVVNENTENAAGRSQDMRSYLLADSELKGYIHAPLDYFRDDEEVSSKQKLDLLMLTHGWRNYTWNNLREKEVEFKPENKFGLTISGKVYKPNSKKILPNAEVSLSLGAENQGFISFTNADLNGYYEFSNLHFYDTALVIVQGKNQRDKANTITTINDQPEPSLPGESVRKHLKAQSELPVAAYRMKYLNELALDEFDPDRRTRLLKPVDIVGTKPEEEKDKHFRIYGTPDNSIKVDENSYHYSNIFQFLVGRVPGVQVVGDNVSIRGISSLMGSNEPLYLLDGVPVDKDFVSVLSMFEIDKIEILKGTNAAIYGMRGGNGVISIFTRTASSSPDIQRSIPGTIIKQIKGFSAFREFYSPQYTAENIESPAPDYRTTLYWNPAVELKSSGDTLTFFTCDNLSKYKVIIEGITSEGRICLGEASFIVDQYRED